MEGGGEGRKEEEGEGGRRSSSIEAGNKYC